MNKEELPNTKYSCGHLFGNCAGGRLYFERRLLKCGTNSPSRCDWILMLEGCVHSLSRANSACILFVSSEQLRIFLMNFETLIKASNRHILTPLYLKSEISSTKMQTKK